jgi:SOS-response transcriptional repressor LexA
MMQAKFPNGLRAAMEAAGIGQAELARMIGVDRANVNRWYKGTRKLPVHLAGQIAGILKVDRETIVFADSASRPDVMRIPLLSWVSAGGLDAVDGVEITGTEDIVLATGLPDGNWIALRVHGDSMDRIAPDGSLILVNRDDRRLIDNAFYVISLPSGETTFKRYRSKGSTEPRLQPYSTNPDHETIYLREDMKPVGRVRRIIHDI